jgi:hypothetical protein
MARPRKGAEAPMIPEGDDVEPHPDDYNPRAVRVDVEAAKDLLLWQRAHGFTAQIVTVGHVQLTNVTDLYTKPAVNAKERSEGRRQRSEMEEEFATDEEIEILQGGDRDER